MHIGWLASQAIIQPPKEHLKPKGDNLHTTSPTKNWRFSASYESFVVVQNFVLRMNIRSKNRQLLVAEKR